MIAIASGRMTGMVAGIAGGGMDEGERLRRKEKRVGRGEQKGGGRKGTGREKRGKTGREEGKQRGTEEEKERMET